MKLIKKTLVAAACVGTLFSAGNAFADVGTIDIYGDVLAICVFGQTTPYAMDFGTGLLAMNPAHTTDEVKHVHVGYRCTAGQAPATFTVNSNPSGSSVNITHTDGVTTLPVKLEWTNPTTVGTGFGTQPLIDIDITGTITAAALNVAKVGTYANHAVALLITP
jgi:hypothetical protein